MENRNGLILDVLVTAAMGTAAGVADLVMLDRRLTPPMGCALGSEGYDTRSPALRELRWRELTPHVVQNAGGGRRSAIDERTSRHPG